ncbi:hypothetical protein Pmi06nite_36880 [Planotetraspora mira]|uniref:UGSC-like domain-containing protein n=1 Tax=Planotetraspora mira TaxID=58121 RepID=A0A8J3X7F1_9ACTN|nr:hypothetical protein Pmi06nite_36880 [Planotetraspora mira]
MSNLCPVKADQDEKARAAAILTSSFGLIDPTATAKGSGTVAPRLPELAGARGVLLDNTKGNAGPLLRHVGNMLEEHYGVRPFEMARKLVYSRPADASLLDDLASQYEFVVTGVGACGSCTSGCVHDAVALETRGIPTVAIHTSVFMNSAIAHAKAFGRSDLQFVEVEHPIAAISDDELRQRAAKIVDSVAAALVGEAA